MCGRFVLTADANTLLDAFGLETVPVQMAPRYNIAPTQPVAVITNAEPKKLTFHRWGLIPSWAKDISIGSKMFNARVETIAEKPSFKNALKRRRWPYPGKWFLRVARKRQKPRIYPPRRRSGVCVRRPLGNVAQPGWRRAEFVHDSDRRAQ
jgi:putative SOS response-associated peptidase YedK